MVAFYKHDIADWMDGTEALDADEYRAYHVVCQLIYLNEGPITLNEKGIAGRCNQSPRLFRRVLDKLVSIGKLRIIDGKLSNARAEAELKQVEANRKNAAKGGGKPKKLAEHVASLPEDGANSKNDGAKPLNNNEPKKAPLNKISSLRDKTDDSVSEAKASSTERGTEWDETRTSLFGGGRQWLQKHSKRSENSTRSLIGRWLKLTGDDAEAVLAAVRKARDAHVAEPVSFIEGILKGANDAAPDWSARAKYFRANGWRDEWGDQRKVIPASHAHLFTTLSTQESEAA